MENKKWECEKCDPGCYGKQIWCSGRIRTPLKKLIDEIDQIRSTHCEDSDVWVILEMCWKALDRLNDRRIKNAKNEEEAQNG